MNLGTSETLTRRIARGCSRRASIMTLGASGFSLLAWPFATEARKQSVAKKARQKCKKQLGQCSTTLAPLCNDDSECLAQVQTCCAIAGTCNAVGWFQCLRPPE
jgi:hypothetical protein